MNWFSLHSIDRNLTLKRKLCSGQGRASDKLKRQILFKFIRSRGKASMEEWFDCCIIIAISLPIHREDKPSFWDGLLEGVAAGILTSPIGVEDHPFLRISSLTGHKECFFGQIYTHVGTMACPICRGNRSSTAQRYSHSWSVGIIRWYPILRLGLGLAHRNST